MIYRVRRMPLSTSALPQVYLSVIVLYKVRILAISEDRRDSVHILKV